MLRLELGLYDTAKEKDSYIHEIYTNINHIEVNMGGNV